MSLQVLGNAPLFLAEQRSRTRKLSPRAPSQPLNVTSITKDAAATVSFFAPTDTGDSAVTHYIVTPYIGVNPQTSTTVPVGSLTSLPGSTAFQADVTGLTNSTAYTFTVRARNSYGESSDSAASGLNTPLAGLLLGDDFKNTTLDPHWVSVTRDGDQSNSELSYYLPAQVQPGSDVMRITTQAASTTSWEYNDISTVANTSGGVATITTNGQTGNGATHGYQIGDTVVVELLQTSTQLNGTWTVTGVTSNTFTFNSGYLTLISSHAETGNARCIAGGHGQVTRSYAAGMVQTAPTPAFLYGSGKTLTVQVRALVPCVGNLWPAIWMLGHDLQTVNLVNPDNVSSGNWNNAGSEEIDIAEFNAGSTTQYNAWLTAAGSSDTPHNVTCTDSSTNYHVYEIRWSSGSLAIVLDGVVQRTITSGVPSAGMFLLLSMPVRGGALSGGPYTLQVDYVHVFNQ